LEQWESHLEAQLETHRRAWQVEAPSIPNPSIQPAAQVFQDDPQRWIEAVRHMLQDELGFGSHPIPQGFQRPVQVVGDQAAMRSRVAKFCGLDESQLPTRNGSHEWGTIHLPGDGTYVNNAHFLQAGSRNERKTHFPAELAQQRWGWGYLLEYTALGQAAGQKGLWPALVADRLGLGFPDPDQAAMARTLRQSWLFVEAGWTDWIWQYVMFKAHDPLGRNLLENPRPGRMFEFIIKILDLFPFYLSPFGLRLRLRNLLDLLRFLFLEQGEAIPNTLNPVLIATHQFCASHDAAIAAKVGMPLSQMLGRFYYAQLEAHIGILATPYATLIACHDEHLNLAAIPDAATLEAALAADARATPDTRLALLSRLDTGVKYDPEAMFIAAWERLRLEGPSRYFSAPFVKP